MHGHPTWRGSIKGPFPWCTLRSSGGSSVQGLELEGWVRDCLCFRHVISLFSLAHFVGLVADCLLRTTELSSPRRILLPTYSSLRINSNP